MRCEYCSGEVVRYKMIITSGKTVVTERCDICGRYPRGKPFVSKKEVADVDSLPLWHDNLADAPACDYFGCMEKGTEYHHYAPRHLFQDADMWATGYLCLKHHREWHEKTKTGSFAKRKS